MAGHQLPGAWGPCLPTTVGSMTFSLANSTIGRAIPPVIGFRTDQKKMNFLFVITTCSSCSPTTANIHASWIFNSLTAPPLASMSSHCLTAYWSVEATYPVSSQIHQEERGLFLTYGAKPFLWSRIRVCDGRVLPITATFFSIFFPSDSSSL